MNDRSPLQQVMLVYLATAADAKRTASALKKDLAAWVESPARLDQTLQALLDAALVAREGRARLVLTPEGSTQAAKLLDHKPGLRWASVKSSLLLGRALGVDGDTSKLAKADTLVATLVARQEGLAVPPGASATRVRDALVWGLLGVKTGKPLTLEAVRRHLLAAHTGLAGDLDSSAMLKQIAARSVSARSQTAIEIQRAAFRRWLAAPVLDLSGFAQQVEHAAARATTGRFGEDKVFVAHVWRAVGSEAGELAAFKQRLLDANRERLLTLVRADLVSTMSPADVAESAIQDGPSEYHFVVRARA